MERFKGNVAIVTGASAGIGAATAKVLAEAGMTVVGFARRLERIEKLGKQFKGVLHAVKVDVTKEEDILRGFKWVTENVGPVHVLVNNAGILAKTDLIDGDTEKWKAIIDTNLLGLTIASREAIKIMRANNIDGHIVNINSTTGHKVVNLPGLNIYPATKHAVTALTETLRLELIRLKSKIKVTVRRGELLDLIQNADFFLSNLSPGLTDTEIFAVFEVTVDAMEKRGGIEVALRSEDVANAVKYVVATPPYVQVTELIIRPVGDTY